MQFGSTDTRSIIMTFIFELAAGLLYLAGETGLLFLNLKVNRVSS